MEVILLNNTSKLEHFCAPKTENKVKKLKKTAQKISTTIFEFQRKAVQFGEKNEKYEKNDENKFNKKEKKDEKLLFKNNAFEKLKTRIENLDLWILSSCEKIENLIKRMKLLTLPMKKVNTTLKFARIQNIENKIEINYLEEKLALLQKDLLPISDKTFEFREIKDSTKRSSNFMIVDQFMLNPVLLDIKKGVDGKNKKNYKFLLNYSFLRKNVFQTNIIHIRGSIESKPDCMNNSSIIANEEKNTCLKNVENKENNNFLNISNLMEKKSKMKTEILFKKLEKEKKCKKNGRNLKLERKINKIGKSIHEFQNLLGEKMQNIRNKLFSFRSILSLKRENKIKVNSLCKKCFFSGLKIIFKILIFRPFFNKSFLTKNTYTKSSKKHFTSQNLFETEYFCIIQRIKQTSKIFEPINRQIFNFSYYKKMKSTKIENNSFRIENMTSNRYYFYLPSSFQLKYQNNELNKKMSIQNMNYDRFYFLQSKISQIMKKINKTNKYTIEKTTFNKTDLFFQKSTQNKPQKNKQDKLSIQNIAFDKLYFFHPSFFQINEKTTENNSTINSKLSKTNLSIILHKSQKNETSKIFDCQNFLQSENKSFPDFCPFSKNSTVLDSSTFVENTNQNHKFYQKQDIFSFSYIHQNNSSEKIKSLFNSKNNSQMKSSFKKRQLFSISNVFHQIILNKNHSKVKKSEDCLDCKKLNQEKKIYYVQIKKLTALLSLKCPKETFAQVDNSHELHNTLLIQEFTLPVEINVFEQKNQQQKEKSILNQNNINFDHKNIKNGLSIKNSNNVEINCLDKKTSNFENLYFLYKRKVESLISLLQMLISRLIPSKPIQLHRILSENLNSNTFEKIIQEVFIGFEDLFEEVRSIKTTSVKTVKSQKKIFENEESLCFMIILEFIEKIDRLSKQQTKMEDFHENSVF